MWIALRLQGLSVADLSRYGSSPFSLGKPAVADESERRTNRDEIRDMQGFGKHPGPDGGIP